jgi:hypothetical protein
MKANWRTQAPTADEALVHRGRWLVQQAGSGRLAVVTAAEGDWADLDISRGMGVVLDGETRWRPIDGEGMPEPWPGECIDIAVANPHPVDPALADAIAAVFPGVDREHICRDCAGFHFFGIGSLYAEIRAPREGAPYWRATLSESPDGKPFIRRSSADVVWVLDAIREQAVAFANQCVAQATADGMRQRESIRKAVTG